MIEALDTSVGAVVDVLRGRDDVLLVFTSDNGGMGSYDSAGVHAVSFQEALRASSLPPAWCEGSRLVTVC